MKTWLVRDARAHFGDVMSAASAGQPQRVTKRGRDAVVVVSEKDWERLQRPRTGKSFEEFLCEFPLSREEWLKVAPRPVPLRTRPLFDED